MCPEYRSPHSGSGSPQFCRHDLVQRLLQCRTRTETSSLCSDRRSTIACTQLTSMVIQLTVDVQVDELDVRPQTRYSRHTLQVGLVVVSAHWQRTCPTLCSVVDRSQTAQTRHRRRVIEPEVVGDVTMANVNIEAGRRISAERDATQRPRLIFDRS